MMQATLSGEKITTTPLPVDSGRVKQGDLWQLGRHRLFCGDCTVESNVEALFGDVLPRYGMYDPPYGMKATGNDFINSENKIGADLNPNWKNVAAAKQYKPVYGDDKPFDPKHLLDITPECILWGGNYYADKLPISKGWIVWDKLGGHESFNQYADYELAWTSFKPAKIYRHLWKGMVREGEREERFHPTQKPAALYEKIMGDLFKDDGIIADLYAGSGPTIIACERLRRSCYAMEIDPYYCDVIIHRWESETGARAVKQ